MSTRLALFLAAIFLFGLMALSDSARSQPHGHDKKTLVVNEVERTYYVRSTFSNPASTIKHPLLIALHGGGSTPDRLMDASNLTTKALKENFIIAYPLGTGPAEHRLSWNAVHCCNFAKENQSQDEDFIVALVDELIATLPVDTNRVYIAGFSNGGMLAYRVASRLGDKVAAIGVISGGMFTDQRKPQAPISMIIFHGKSDGVIPYEGGHSKKSILKSEIEPPFMSIADIHQFWLQENNCPLPPQEIKRGNIHTLASHKCLNNVSVVVNSIRNSGHNWPGASQGIYTEYDDGSYYLGFSATDALWSFFQKHPKE